MAVSAEDLGIARLTRFLHVFLNMRDSDLGPTPQQPERAL